MKIKTLLVTAFAVSTLFISGLSLAEDTTKGMYMGVSAGSLDDDYTYSTTEDTLHFITGAGLLGYNFNQHFALEGRLGLGLQKDEIAGREFNIDSCVSILVKGSIPIDGGTVYALAGLSNIKYTAEYTYLGTAYSESEDESDISFGVGAELPVYTNGMLGIEYLKLIDKRVGNADHSVGSIAITLRHSF